MRFGSLFSGIGGIDLGLERAGMECVWQVEIDEYCNKVLAKHWPQVERYGDVGSVGKELSDVDLIAGGFPCQDISNAHTRTKREGLAGELSGLWSQFCRVVEFMCPRWVLAENVSAWERWVPGVRCDLWSIGYASVPIQLSAGSFGARHKRPRTFVVAHADGDSEPLRAIHAEVASLRPVPATRWDWGTSPSRGFRMDDGVPRGMDRCRVMGNACVPQVVEWIGRRVISSVKGPE